MPCTEGLTGLSVRWVQPIQQQGRRIPCFSSMIVLLTCSFLVSSFLTNITQHIHSLRASGVRSCHLENAAGSADKARLKSKGILCTVPDAMFVIDGGFRNPCGYAGLQRFLSRKMRIQSHFGSVGLSVFGLQTCLYDEKDKQYQAGGRGCDDAWILTVKTTGG